ncbi:hypothetical protein RKD24_000893 [Streptomyces calvus]
MDITRAGHAAPVRPRGGGPSQQSGAGAANDDHSNASGDRGCLRPHGLCDGPASPLTRPGGPPVPVGRAASGRAGRDAGGAGTGTRGAGDDRPLPALEGVGVAVASRRSGDAHAAAAHSGRRRRAQRAAWDGRTRPGHPATPSGGPAGSRRVDGLRRLGRVRAGTAVRRLACGQPGGGRLPPDVRRLSRRASFRAPAASSGADAPCRSPVRTRPAGPPASRPRARSRTPRDRYGRCRGGPQPPGVPSSPSRVSSRRMAARTPSP